MKKLRKQDRARFDAICEVIRETLHLEHHCARYTFSTEDESGTHASSNMLLSGRRLWIEIGKAFWGLTAEEQVRTLIHEHIHVVVMPYDQSVFYVVKNSHESDARWADAMVSKTREHVTDHLECVIFDLMKGMIP